MQMPVPCISLEAYVLQLILVCLKCGHVYSRSMTVGLHGNLCREPADGNESTPDCCVMFKTPNKKLKCGLLAGSMAYDRIQCKISSMPFHCAQLTLNEIKVSAQITWHLWWLTCKGKNKGEYNALCIFSRACHVLNVLRSSGFIRSVLWRQLPDWSFDFHTCGLDSLNTSLRSEVHGMGRQRTHT